MKRLLSIAFKSPVHRWLVVLIVLAMCLLTIANQTEILTIGIITQKSMPPTEHGLLNRVTDWINARISIDDHLTHLALLIFFVALFKAVVLFTHRFSTRLLAIRVSADLRQRYFEHIQSLPMTFYQHYNMGSISSRVVGDAALIAEALNACLVNYLQTPFTVLTTLTFCFLTSWQLSLLIFLGFPCIIFPIVFIANRVRRISRQIQRNQETFTSVLLDFLGGIQTVKVFAMEDFSLEKYKERNDKMAALEVKSARYDLSSRPVVHTIAMLFLATALLYGLYVIHLGVSEVLVYCGMLYLFYEPVKKFAEENSHIQRGITAAERMFEVLDMKSDMADAPGSHSFASLQHSIEFKNVSFRYLDEWVLKDLSFTIKKGESVALVGPTGAGKSTIAQLLPRLYDIQGGEILFDGKPIHSYTQKSIREAISFVPQRPFLFIDTVAANISYGKGFSQEQIVKAATRAHADEFIQKLPQGYQTEIDEGGKNLSGGQQQRLAIARALVKNAPILILDEATSALDAISEHYIKSAVKDLHGSVTQVIIAHRLSTIEYVDKIIYLENGQKVAEGPRDELLRICPGFKRMYDMMMLQKS